MQHWEVYRPSKNHRKDAWSELLMFSQTPRCCGAILHTSFQCPYYGATVWEGDPMSLVNLTVYKLMVPLLSDRDGEWHSTNEVHLN